MFILSTPFYNHYLFRFFYVHFPHNIFSFLYANEAHARSDESWGIQKESHSR